MKNNNKRKKIAFIAGQCLPVPAIKGGAIETLLTAFINQNEIYGKYDITVYCGSDESIQEVSGNYNNCKIVGIPKKITLYSALLYMYRAIRKYVFRKLPFRTQYMETVNNYLRKEKYNCIICESTYVDAAQIRKTNGEKLIYHVHSDYLKKSTPDIKKIFDRVDLFLGVSDFIASRIDDISGENDVKVHSLKNAIEVEQYQVEKQEREQIRNDTRKELGVENDTVIIYCGRLSPEKGCSELISAMNNVQDATLLVVGGETFSSNQTTEYVINLKEKAEKIRNKVIFTGYVDHKQIRQYLFAADIAVVPSICNEAASLTLLEFRAATIPTVVSQLGGIPEYCSENTIQIPFGNDFVQNLGCALNELSSNISNIKIEDALIQTFNYKHYYENFSQIIDNLINQ